MTPAATSPTKGKEAKDISVLPALDEVLDGLDAVEVLRRQNRPRRAPRRTLHQLRHDRDDIQRVDQAVVDEGRFVLKVNARTNLRQDSR